MQHDIANAQAFMTSLTVEWQNALINDVINYVTELDSSIECFIQYKMLAVGYANSSAENQSMCCINAQKNYVSLYVGNVNRVDPTGELSEHFDCGQACVRIRKRRAHERTKVYALLDAVYRDWRSSIKD
ncbi:hypothetical protein [Alteromonas flava]|uniref:hypothetical protein n=1 Tax=Alteromonas flava TaxID=2048003 RepID=UPI000C28DCE3|nr:hypothetical protein [Alteromonas flava]